MNQTKNENIIKAIEWLTERIAELQCYYIPAPRGENPQKYIDDNIKDKIERIRDLLKSA